MRKEQKYVKNRLQHILNDTRKMQSPLSRLWETLEDKQPSSSIKRCKRGKRKDTHKLKEMLNMHQPISYGFHLDPDLTKLFKGEKKSF